MKKIPVYKYGEIVDYALVDDSDYEELSQIKWVWNKGYAYKRANKAERAKYGTTAIYMHRLIMKPKTSRQFVDHIDCNKLNNTRENLRFASDSQNKLNQRKKQGNYTSQFKGVYYCRRSKKWIAQIHIEKGKQIKLGFFDDEMSAAKAYNEAAEKYHGEWAKLNII